MRLTASIECQREHDDDSGHWWETYAVTVEADVTSKDAEEFLPTSRHHVTACDADGDAHAWKWGDLSSREQDEVETDLYRQAEELEEEGRRQLRAALKTLLYGLDQMTSTEARAAYAALESAGFVGVRKRAANG